MQEENLPDPRDFAFNQFILNGKYFDGSPIKAKDLWDQGWRLDARQSTEKLKPNTTSIISVSGLYLYNGLGLVRAGFYNSSRTRNCTYTDADIAFISASVEDNVSLIVADGLTFGSTFDEVKAVFGTNYRETERWDGTVYYEYNLNGLRNGFTFDADGLVNYIYIEY